MLSDFMGFNGSSWDLPSGKTYKQLWKIIMLLMGKSTNFLWPCSIAMLVF